MRKPQPGPLFRRSEADKILAFALATLEPSETHTAVEVVFAAYQAWLAKVGHPETTLSIDSFGRLFPKSYPRRVICRAGENRRRFVGAVLR